MNEKSKTKVIAVPFTLKELDVLHEVLGDPGVANNLGYLPRDQRKQNQEESDIFVSLKETVDHYFELARKNPDSLPAVSLLNAEHQMYLDKLNLAVLGEGGKRPIHSPWLRDDPRQLEIPLVKTIDRVAELEGGIPVGDPQDPTDDDGDEEGEDDQ